MYGRELDDRILDFGHEGVLYRNSFMMYDHQTESLWLHVTGQALKGPLKGSQLKFLPSEVTSWREWRRRHPDTGVILGEKASGFMGSFGLRERIADYGLSVGSNRRVVLFPFRSLLRLPVLQDRAPVGAPETSSEGVPVLVVFDAVHGRALAFRPRVAERTLHFQALLSLSATGEDSLLMRDVESGSLWDALRGSCIAGPRIGQRLERIPATPWLVERWEGFFPEGRVVELPGNPVTAQEAARKPGQ